MSIRARLLWLVAIATLVPAILIGLRFLQDREAGIDAARSSLSAAATAMARDLDDKIQGTAQLLYGLSRASDLDTTDRAACSAFLSAVREEYPQYTGILTIRSDGQLFCDSLRTGRNLDLRDRAYFRQALQQTGVVALQPAFGRLTGISVLQIALAPKSSGDAPGFVLLASLNLAKFASDYQERLPPGYEILIVDEDGTLLAATRDTPAATLVGKSIADTPVFGLLKQSGSMDGGRTVGEISSAPDRREVWAATPLPSRQDAGLRIFVGQSKAVLVNESNRSLAFDLSLLAGVAALLFAGAWLLAEVVIRRDVQRIAAMASRLAKGDLGARIPGKLPGGELGGLMVMLNQTANSLQEQRAAIEDLNQRLLRAQRMEAVGQLTGGLAHDFNNLLTVILGNADHLAESLPNDPKLRQMAELTRLAAERGAELTKSLLAFARRQPLEPKETDIGALIRGMEVLLRRTLGEDVECRLETAPDCWPALVDPAQTEAAVLNLVLNARDAMPGGGRLTLETGNTRLDAGYASANEDVVEGDYVVISVTDTGKGMTQDVIAQAFEPFFTTKEFGKGSGLGLSMVYGFAKQSGGHVKIYSEPDDGTTVKLFLPRALGTPAEAPVTDARESQGGGETILAVEDDEMVRDHVVAELEALGYRVIAARNGAEAIDHLKGDTAIDLLFTDVVMPGGLSGPQVAREAERLRPGIAILYTSGYTENAVVHHGRLDPGVVLLSKPYRRQELADKLRLVLARRQIGRGG